MMVGSFSYIQTFLIIAIIFTTFFAIGSIHALIIETIFIATLNTITSIRFNIIFFTIITNIITVIIVFSAIHTLIVKVMWKRFFIITFISSS